MTGYPRLNCGDIMRCRQVWQHSHRLKVLTQLRFQLSHRSRGALPAWRHCRHKKKRDMNSTSLVLAQFGCGYWGPNLLRNFSAVDGCEVRYVVDSSPERRAFVETNFPRTR